MKRAYCSDCGQYVVLDGEGSCPQGHPRSCYRDMSDDAGPDRPTRAEPPTSPSRGNGLGRGVWIVAIVAAVLLCLGGGLSLIRLMQLREVNALATRPPAAQPAAPIASAPVATYSAPKPAADGAFPPFLPSKRIDYRTLSSTQRRWGLALDAILTEMNHDSENTLGGVAGTPTQLQALRQRLLGYGVHDRKTLLAALAALEHGGDRSTFDETRAALSKATPAQIAAFKARFGASAAASVDLVISESASLGDGGIAAWDFGRYVSLVRWGYALGYLSESEAWQRIIPAAAAMQKTYSSWRQFSEAYVVGREFWGGDPSSDGYVRSLRIQLLVRPNSPWVQLPWGLKLM